MNLSGQAVKEVINFYKAPLEDLLVIHDDKDQVFGKIKFQKAKGHGGHNRCPMQSYPFIVIFRFDICSVLYYQLKVKGL